MKPVGAKLVNHLMRGSIIGHKCNLEIGSCVDYMIEMEFCSFLGSPINTINDD